MSEKLKKVTIYTDGACSGNPGNGGWGAVLIYKKNVKMISGNEKETTNNKMELTAVLQGLKKLKYKCEVKVCSDSAYVVNAFNKGWINNWYKNNWKRADGELANKELWVELFEVVNKHKVKFVKVKGHADDEFNVVADELAVKARKELEE